MKPVLVLQNITLEDPGTMESFLRKRNIPLEIFDLYQGQSIPDDPERFGAVISLGGPMNVDEEDRFPFLAPEKRWLRECVEAHVPVLGVCLGGQLLAAALGARVMKNPVPEIGWMYVDLSPDGQRSALLQGLSTPLPVFQWHGDTFELPPSSTLLATSPECRYQAFQVNENAFGLQFHLEVTADDTVRWARTYIHDVGENTRPVIQRLIDQPDTGLAEQIHARAERMYANFFCGICGYE